MLDFVAIDFETANENGESACALGVVDVKGGAIVAANSWLIRPPDEFFTVRKRNREIHGIGRSALKDQQRFKEIWPSISHYFSNRIVVAHNAASTEIDILRKLFIYFSIEPPDFQYFCTLKLAKASWYESLKACGLKQIAQFLGCDFSHHDPEDDARVCANFLIRACNDANVDSVEELAKNVKVPVNQFSLVNNEQGKNICESNFASDQVETHFGFTTEEIQICSSNTGTYTRGRDLFAKGKVQVISKSGFVCEGLVSGSGKNPYEVSLDASLNAKCNCPAWRNSGNRFCKHCVALALLWESEGGPTPVKELSENDKRISILRRIQQLSPKQCKDILTELADNEPELISRLLFD